MLRSAPLKSIPFQNSTEYKLKRTELNVHIIGIFDLLLTYFLALRELK